MYHHTGLQLLTLTYVHYSTPFILQREQAIFLCHHEKQIPTPEVTLTLGVIHSTVGERELIQRSPAA